MNPLIFIAVILAGFLAGIINTIAGSGSLITLPILIFLGLPSPIANGTNRVAILLQNIVGVSSFNHKKALDVRGALYLSIPAALGSILGSWIAVDLNSETMDRAIGLVMVAMLFVIFLKPSKWLEGNIESISGIPTPIQLFIFFLIGIYGGFIQAGVGIFLLSGLVLSIGYNLVRANAVKVAIVLIYTAFSLTIFAINQQVNWSIGLILAIGNMSGAWVGSRLAVEKGAVWVRRLLIVIIIISSSKLLLGF